jgi:hypothetical protein
MMRTALGEDRGEFGFSAKSCRVGLSCLSLSLDLEMTMIPHDKGRNALVEDRVAFCRFLWLGLADRSEKRILL